MKEIFLITFVIIGALIGAGFASGQEIYSFFFVFGKNGIFGIILTCLMISILIYKTLKIIYKYNIENYSQLQSKFIQNKKIIVIINSILNILLLISFYIMIAGFGAYFEQELEINKLIGSTILAIICMIIFFTNVKGVLKVSEFVVPALILSIIIIGTKNIIEIQDWHIEEVASQGNWIVSSIIYSSYNMILLIPVLISLRKTISSQKSIKFIAIFTGIIMLITTMMIYLLLLRVDVTIKPEMPIVYVVSKFYNQFKKIYAFIILASIFTTAISIGTGFLQNTSKNQRSYTQLMLIMCITSLIISNFGFSKLVNNAYPIFGYLGIVQIFYLLKIK